MATNLAQIEQDLEKISTAENIDRSQFIFDLLSAYGIKQNIISRLQNGSLNKAKEPNAIIWKTKVFFKSNEDSDTLQDTFAEMRFSGDIKKYSPRFLITTDFETLLAFDVKTEELLNISISELHLNTDFFMPWAGVEKFDVPEEALADVRAADRMAKLYDQLNRDNEIYSQQEVHGLNIFLTRLLFCFFAEDTNIFEKNLFTNSVASHTQQDGSDVASHIEKMFEMLNVSNVSRLENSPTYLKKFPYVNGGLFKDFYPVPPFSRRSRQLLIDCGGLDWSDINPDIFGSMIQAVVTSEHRGELAMHYTSVPNIMKVIKPLFLDELEEEYQQSIGNVKALERLLVRLSKIKVFDPACGSGNFLIIAYRELRLLEIKIIQGLPYRLHLSDIKLTQFYGIELDDFAHEVALLSLWLAEHKMNVLFEAETGCATPSLPLKSSGNIVCGNATRVDWQSVCPRNETDEVYVLGNPPYKGARRQSEEQKTDIFHVFKHVKEYNSLDYIACWFCLGARYIKNTNAKYAFVTTNSVCQGEQVAPTWTDILAEDIEIFFAYSSFIWQNNAKDKAKVTCTIIGLRIKSNELKHLFDGKRQYAVKNINAYLVDANNIYTTKRTKNISKFPEICFGSMPNDGGNLLVNKEFKQEIEKDYPASKILFKKILGSKEFIRGEVRYCLWITDSLKDLAYSIPKIRTRIEACRNIRNNSTREATNKLSAQPYLFGEIRYKTTSSIIIPSVSSERREYIPIGCLDSNTVISNLAFAIYDADFWIFAVVTSRMHNVWVRAVGGRLKTDYRYSATLCYNTFPFPRITERQKDELSDRANSVLEIRATHQEQTFAELYDPEKMPDDLRQAHQDLDESIEGIYRQRPFENDEERLAYLFEQYEKMTKKK